ncbi:alpha/beta fold hydrolase [Nakamurella sp. GG22]
MILLPAFGRRASGRIDPAPERLATLLLGEVPVGGPVVIIGHSASCQIAAEAAVLAPDRVAGLVLVGPTTDPRATTWSALGGRWLRTAVHERPSQVPLLVGAYARTGPVSMARGMNAARQHRIDRTLADVTCPVLVVRGPHDAICPADWAAELAASTGRGSSETLHGGAHMVPVTHPDALAASVLDFIDKRVLNG